MSNIIDLHQHGYVASSDDEEALDQQIKDETNVLNTMGKQTIEQGIKVGKLYKEKKSHLNHGEWMPWVEANLSVKIRWVNEIMKLSENESILNWQCTANLTGIEPALKFIREEEAKNKPEPEPLTHEQLSKQESTARLKEVKKVQTFDADSQKRIVINIVLALRDEGVINDEWIESLKDLD